MQLPAPLIAILAAAVFGISPALIKASIGNVPPVLLAGLLYLGSGIGLLGFRVARCQAIFEELRALSTIQKYRLIGAIVSGGIIAPVFLTYGLRTGTAFEVSGLLNLETVATTIIAWLFFHEHIGWHVWIGKVLVLVGAFVMCVQDVSSVSISPAVILLCGACLFWGLDNNLTRDVEDLAPSLLAGVKGLVAGTFNILLGLLLRESFSSFDSTVIALGIGAISYGLSLVLFVLALRLMGASRTSTYFATGPFLGMIFSLVILGERPSLIEWIGSAIMVVGVWTLYREHHEHVHSHEGLTHSHPHYPDIHHRHRH
ncbi:DMT family transporter [Bdellovibrionota bacterium FG-2]